MRLFFETSGQAGCFAAMIPVGFFVTLGLSVGIRHAAVRFGMDLLIFFSATAAVAGFLLLSREPALRLYHVLGFLAGGILYFCGVGRIVKRIFPAGRKTPKNDEQLNGKDT